MKRILTSSSFILLSAAMLLFVSSCKKDKSSELSFSASSATVDEAGTATVDILISEPSSEVIEIDFASTGTDPLRFGSYDAVFLRDDSEKLEAKIDPVAFIDTMGHVKISAGTKKVTISFTQKGDAFPHASASFQLKMVSAKNASINSGSDTYTYNINQAPLPDYSFTSTLVYNGAEEDAIGGTPSKTGSFTLSDFTYTENGNGNFDLVLNYGLNPDLNYTTQVTKIRVTYADLPKFEVGPHTFNCGTTSGIKVEYNPPVSGQSTDNMATLSCTEFTDSHTNIPVTYSPIGGGVYGDYMVFLGNYSIVAPGLDLKALLNSQFIVY